MWVAYVSTTTPLVSFRLARMTRIPCCAVDIEKNLLSLQSSSLRDVFRHRADGTHWVVIVGVLFSGFARVDADDVQHFCGLLDVFHQVEAEGAPSQLMDWSLWVSRVAWHLKLLVAFLAPYLDPALAESSNGQNSMTMHTHLRGKGIFTSPTSRRRPHLPSAT